MWLHATWRGAELGLSHRRDCSHFRQRLQEEHQHKELHVFQLSAVTMAWESSDGRTSSTSELQPGLRPS